MKFIEDHQADAGETGVALEHAGQNPFRQHLDARRRPYPRIHAHTVADGLADRLAEHVGHAHGGGPGR